MSLTVFVAHTGQRLLVEPASYSSFEAFKSWLSRISAIPDPSQVLLLASGKQAKFQSLFTDRELFLYDRQLIASVDQHSLPCIELELPPRDFISEIPSDSLSNPKDLAACRGLFQARAAWAVVIGKHAGLLGERTTSYLDSIAVIQRALAVAFGNLQSHVRALQQKHEEAQHWAQQSNEEHRDILDKVQDIVPQLAALPAHAEFVPFLSSLRGPISKVEALETATNTTLVGFVNEGHVKLARMNTQTTTDEIASRIAHLNQGVAQVVRNVVELNTNKVPGIDGLQTENESLLEEIRVIASKACSDRDHVSQLRDEPGSFIQAAKMATVHTRSHLPALLEYLTELEQTHKQSVDLRNKASALAIDTMQRIAKLEAAIGQANQQIRSLDISLDAADAYDLLATVTQLPFLYGALLVESLRRHEWTSKIKNDSATLAEDIASCREAEERRRKKWLKNMGHFVNQDVALTKSLSFELSLQADEATWPHVTREDLIEYLVALRDLQGLDAVYEELSEAAKELDKPLRGMSKRTNLFKLGSMLEASTMTTSLTLKEAEDLRSLRNANTKLDEELRGQRSRVRKLEELLYKQHQPSRSNSGNMSFPVESQPWDLSLSERASSPKAYDAHPGKRSLSSRKSSTHRSDEVQSMARRIVDLENQISEERTNRAKIEQDERDKRDAIETEMREIHAVKQDLMENMEARKQEFSLERRNLEDEIAKYKVRIEEYEDEFDRFLGSRDNYKASAEEKLHSVEAEVEKQNKALTEMREELDARDEVQQDQFNTLATVHTILAPDQSLPQLSADLVDALEALAQRSASHEKELHQAIASVRSEHEAVERASERYREEKDVLQKRLDAAEREKIILRNELDAERARTSSLAMELDDGRSQLRDLRTKFAEGETGSEVLRSRVESQAARASSLASQLAEAKSQVKGLEMELSSIQRRHQQLQQSQTSLSNRLVQRSGRDKELTTRLVSRNEHIARLIDSLGLTALSRDGQLEVTRTSKLSNASASTTLSDLVTTGILPTESSPRTQVSFDASPSSTALQWMNADNMAEEEKSFGELVDKVDAFRLDVISEAIIKLRRDVEWTGKKWKTEARSYRDKYHRTKGEGQDKIAFRSFKEGDLALFLPTRNQATRPWAAFNVGAPHYFLREQESHKLKDREWLVARIGKMSERVVDLSKTIDSLKGADGRSIGETSDVSVDENPFELSDGLRWYLLDAAEEKGGAPTTPGFGRSTVASANVDAKGSIRMKKTAASADASSKLADASSKLNKSLDSRRSSTASKAGSVSGGHEASAAGTKNSSPERAPAAGAVDAARAGAQATLRPTSSRVSVRGAPGAGGRVAQLSRESIEEVRNDALPRADT